MSVEGNEKAIGQHGANIFFKEFAVRVKSVIKTYRLGLFYIVRKSSEYPVAIAEFQLIWLSTKDGKKYATVKLYFNPAETDHVQHDLEGLGQDEVVEAQQHIVIECSQFSKWECSSSLWYDNLGKIAYDGIPASVLENIYKDNPKVTFKQSKGIKILNYAQYCRYKTCLNMLQSGIKMSGKLLISRGGLELDNWNTLILFARWKFSKEDASEFSLTEGVQAPVFKGRPRKKRPAENLNIKKMNKFDKQRVIEERVNGSNGAYTDEPIALEHISDSEENTATEKQDTTDKKSITDKDPAAFKKAVHQFMKKRGTPIIKIPSIGYAKIDLYQLFVLVSNQGGYGQVTLKKQWRSIYEMFGHCTTITNSATCTRKAYEKLLLPYEKYLRNKQSVAQADDKAVNSSSKTSETDVGVRERNTKDVIVKEIRAKEPLESYQPKIVRSKSTEIVQVNAAGSVINPIPSMHTSEPTVCTLNPTEVGDAFKLMIQKRRGRPSKEFREKIEQLKNMKQKVEVEIYPPLSKRSKAPAWLNELNVDIVNPSARKRKSSGNEEKVRETKRPEISILPKPSEPSELSSTDKLNFCGEAPRYTYPSSVVIHKPDYTVAKKRFNEDKESCNNESEKTSEPDICEFEIKSVRSLAPHDESKFQKNLIHYPNTSNMPAISVPYSVLSYGELYSPTKGPIPEDQSRNQLVTASTIRGNPTFRQSQFAAHSFGHNPQISKNASRAYDQFYRERPPGSPTRYPDVHVDDMYARRVNTEKAFPRYHTMRHVFDDRRLEPGCSDKVGAEQRFIVHHPSHVRAVHGDKTLVDYPVVYQSRRDVEGRYSRRFIPASRYAEEIDHTNGLGPLMRSDRSVKSGDR